MMDTSLKNTLRPYGRVAISLACLVGALTPFTVPSFARAASAPKCVYVIGANQHLGRCGATFMGSKNVRVQIAANGVITRTPATATIHVRPNFNNVLAVYDSYIGAFVYVADGAISGQRTYALLPPTSLMQFKRETLRIVTGSRTVYGGRTTCPSRMLSHSTPVRGCQDVLITTNPWSRVLITIGYGAHTHYSNHRSVYADAKGVYQLVFPVVYNPSLREHRIRATVDVTVALGHAVKSGRTGFGVLHSP